MYGKIWLRTAAVLPILLGASPAVHALPAKACDLMTQQAAAAISGHPVAPGYEEDIGKSINCKFNAAEGGQVVSVGILDPQDMGVSPQMMFQIAVDGGKGKPDTTSETIPGLGENAFYTDANPGTAVADSTLSVLHHGKILILDLNGLAPNNSQNPDRKAALVQAAKQILGQM
jgi:hypothetical protein